MVIHWKFWLLRPYDWKMTYFCIEEFVPVPVRELLRVCLWGQDDVILHHNMTSYYITTYCMNTTKAYTGPKHMKMVTETFFAIQWTLAYPTTTGPDHGQISKIAGYVNHHANSVYSISLLALPFLFLSCYPLSVQTIIVFWPLQASNGWNSGIFGCSNNLVQATLLHVEHGH